MTIRPLGYGNMSNTPRYRAYRIIEASGALLKFRDWCGYEIVVCKHWFWNGKCYTGRCPIRYEIDPQITWRKVTR